MTGALDDETQAMLARESHGGHDVCRARRQHGVGARRRRPCAEPAERLGGSRLVLQRIGTSQRLQVVRTRRTPGIGEAMRDRRARSLEAAAHALGDAPLAGFTDLGFARLDSKRGLRTGDPEVVYGAGKTPDQVVAERLTATPALANATPSGRAGPGDIIKARLIAENAKEVSQPGR